MTDSVPPPVPVGICGKTGTTTEGEAMFGWLMRLLGLRPAAPAAAETTEDETAAVGRPGQPLAVVPTEEGTAATQVVVAGSTSGTPPWDRTHCAPAMEPTIVRRRLRAALDELAASTTSEGDRAFVQRIEKLVESDQLDLPPFPDVARELDELLQQTTTDILQIARVVERDPGLVRRVWTHARSAMYASAPRSLHHAVARVGLDALWRIGMSVCLNDTVFRVEGHQAEAAQVREHGIVTAEVAAMLAGERRGSLYLAGLLHGVGDLILLRCASEPQTRRPSLDILERVGNIARSPLGVLVAHSWKLDDVAVAGIGFQADPEAAPRSQQRGARIVRAAVIAAHGARLELEDMAYENADPTALIQGLGLDGTKALERAREVYAELRAPGDPAEG